MIVHEIARYAHKAKFKAGSYEHRDQILKRNLIAVQTISALDPGEYVHVKGKGRGMIIYHEDDLRKVEWDGLKVKFIEVWFEKSNETEFFHPSDIKV